MLSKKLWGGRFSKSTDKAVEAFTESISFDCRLIEHDIRGSIAHAKMLGKCGIIPEADAKKIVSGLGFILDDYLAGKIVFDPSAEDVHMNVEKLLFEKIGEPAGKLHTARSRNDQVCTDIRLFLKAEIARTAGLIEELQKVAVDQAENNAEVILPGYTHLQHAQPVLLGHHLMAYFWMLERDKGRMLDCLKRLDVLPLGSGALAGTTFPIDREYVAKQLGFDSVSDNSMDSVADRDFIVEFLSSAAMLMVHLSRFAEELIIWNTSEFKFVELDDSVTTGSSIMPQKKNPDVAELVRGKSARVIGDLVTLLTLQKGLPLAYNRDLQEDKEPLFDAVDTVTMSLQVFALMLDTARFNADRMYKAAGEAFSTATDLADHLVRAGVPFRTAHEQVGSLVAYCVGEGKELFDLTIDEIRRFAPEASDDVASELTVEASVAARKATGGTALSEVKRQIEKARRIVECRMKNAE
ncbi:MAG: argininosuccinate lyase [Chloroflexi bacterium]|nr:argininosuccinate lyase [Chloroflexota bacterium]MCL5104140.1 argininosuccinate lyase [Armatimonadota bacterium]